jgi:hypothetical protein
VSRYTGRGLDASPPRLPLPPTNASRLGASGVLPGRCRSVFRSTRKRKRACRRDVGVLVCALRRVRRYEEASGERTRWLKCFFPGHPSVGRGYETAGDGGVKGTPPIFIALTSVACPHREHHAIRHRHATKSDFHTRIRANVGEGGGAQGSSESGVPQFRSVLGALNR